MLLGYRGYVETCQSGWKSITARVMILCGGLTNTLSARGF